jgi:hypothetical protein
MQNPNDMGVVRYLGAGGILASGCMSANACNYDPTAAVDDGSCYFIGDPCDDGLTTTDNDAYKANCICEGVSSVEESNVFGLSIFPNPSENELTLTSDVAGKGTVTVVDMTGRVTLQQKMVISSTQKINIQNLPSGIYSLMVSIENKQSVISFVKI